MNEKTLSIIRHVLTSLGVLAAALGLTSFAGIINITLVNLDAVWQAILTLIGAITAYKGFNAGRPQ